MGKTYRTGQPPSQSHRQSHGRPRARSKTRAERPHLIDDAQVSERALAVTLTKMGLYAAHTIGDGNCLFRALSDQYYGSPSQHLQVRHQICEFVASQSEKYRLFVDEDSVPGGFEGHVREMRLTGTYGTHIEISAFAQLVKRGIKVVQPGLVYVIEGEDLSPGREKGKKREEEDEGPLYLVYHSWEHYSSLRNISGPHTGLPHVREIPPPRSPRRQSQPLIIEPLPPPPPAPPSPPTPPTLDSSIATLKPSPPPPPKRGRGRPRKHPIVELPTPPTSADDDPSPSASSSSATSTSHPEHWIPDVEPRLGIRARSSSMSEDDGSSSKMSRQQSPATTSEVSGEEGIVVERERRGRGRAKGLKGKEGTRRSERRRAKEQEEVFKSALRVRELHI